MSAANCRACAGSISLVLDLGLMPPSRRFLSRELACQPEPLLPLKLMRCDTCGLLQLEGTTAAPLAALRELARNLAPSSIAGLELPDLLALHDRLAVDLICHETTCYFSLAQLGALLAAERLEIVDVAPEPCGTRRVTVQRRGGSFRRTPAVEFALAQERTAELDQPRAWTDFAHLVEHGRDLLSSELDDGCTETRASRRIPAAGAGSRRWPTAVDRPCACPASSTNRPSFTAC